MPPSAPIPTGPDPGRLLRQFITADLVAITGGVLLCASFYLLVVRSIWMLALAGVCTACAVIVGAAARPAKRGDYQSAVTLICLGNWATALLVTFIAPVIFPVMLLTTLLPVVFAMPYVTRRRLRAYIAVTTGWVLLLGLVRFQHVSDLPEQLPEPLANIVSITTLPAVAALILLIVWQNAAVLREHIAHTDATNDALRRSQRLLAQRAEELVASRSRLVAVTDTERRRIERDLHDGAQQQLVALAVNLRLARHLAERDPRRSTAVLAELSEQLHDAIAEIRRLAHGIYPPQLTAQGLAHALPIAAAKSAVPTQVHTSGIRRYPAQLETAVYFCCLEALQNAAKHAGDAATATITAEHDDKTGLSIVITDTGTGFDPAHTTLGAGLTNMADRLAIHAGTLHIDSRPHHGTQITITIPNPTPAALGAGPGLTQIDASAGP